jgi:hypothetical protein
MKKLFAIMLPLSLLSAVTFGQAIGKGTVMVGGSLGFNTGEGTSQFNMNPNIGFFVGDNFALGGFVSYSSRNFGNTKVNDFGVGPFARYYFGVTQTKPFLVTEFEYLSTTTRVDEIKTTASGFGFLFGMGFSAFINETVAIEGITGYNYNDFKDADGSGGFAMRFGFQIYLGRNSMQSLKTNVVGQ